MNLNLSFEESVHGCTKVNSILFSKFSTKKGALALLARAANASQALSLRNAEIVEGLGFRQSGRACS